MRLVLDSQAVIWAVDDPERLGTYGRSLIEDPENELLLSAATVWELSIKTALRKLRLSQPYRTWMTRVIHDLGLTLVPITVEAAYVQSTLPFHHRDPFDRLLVAQAMIQCAPIVSSDIVFEQYGVVRLW